ncbi:tyrosine-type recombinase/integrase [Nostoc sp. FACHB-110]|uniref:tyrosine-type recombinase/integrase n=1 Tax=Nostoc sp. FACHB-110 TaxID=2692834 RepID=UPI00168364AF|nr:tyrosine-type recombinase/integrase [Nostoc sp. FACHB-110]MBD2437348.1 tyrosine-type recombinase/integrase [Nostoc sp. FACHB-110]
MSSLSRVSTDQKLIEMWLHGRPLSTQKEYRRDVQVFLGFVDKDLQECKLEDLQGYSSYLDEQGIKPTTKKRKLNSLKSLFTFATKLNYIRFNVAAALRMPKGDTSLAGRILKQSEVLRLISHPQLSVRDRSFLKLTYATGARVSEVCRLKWEDFQERDSGEVQVTLLGKGEKLRTVLVPVSVWIEMQQLRGSEYVFIGATKNPIDRVMAHHIIKNAAALSGITSKVSMHWLRHCNASHALARGASLALVRDSLGHSSVAISDPYLHANPSDSTSNYLGL